ncbi:MAG TPA: serine hydrolase domain-containing protein [Candidatus Saccharimonadia bacterium]|nr:serine hydrolase domain-containing protein [Candidatus Saccharimonadia bacterium]
MGSSGISQSIQAVISQAIKERVFPGAVVGVIAKNQRTVMPFGRLTYEPSAHEVTTDTVYDVASITKSIPVSTIILTLIERDVLKLDDRVIKVIPEIKNDYREQILIKHLLTFTMAFDMPRRLSAYAEEGGEILLQALFDAPLQAPPGEEYCYSNAPAILLGLIAERILKKSLDIIADELFFSPLHMRHTTFHPNDLPNALIAPSEINWRGEIKGVVHDEAAWALQAAGIIAGNAGVFSIADDLLTFAEMLLADGTYKERTYFSPKTVAQMHSNQIAEIGGSIGLGWELGQAHFMGDEASQSCFGKVGYTGSMILIDPLKDTALVLLTNRTYPTRPSDGTAINQVRRALSDLVFAE